MAKLSVAKVPCGSCPYRRDVPSGIWEQHEYDKLPEYDGQTWEQNPALFLCHQRGVVGKTLQHGFSAGTRGRGMTHHTS